MSKDLKTQLLLLLLLLLFLCVSNAVVRVGADCHRNNRGGVSDSNLRGPVRYALGSYKSVPKTIQTSKRWYAQHRDRALGRGKKIRGIGEDVEKGKDDKFGNLL